MRAELLDKVGQVLQARGAYAAAEPLFQQAHAINQAQLGSDHPKTRDARERLAALYDAWDRPDEAARLRADA